MYDVCDFEETLNGVILSEIVANGYSIIFTTIDLKKYELSHDQDCCEAVYIEDITGCLESILDYPLTVTETFSNDNGVPGNDYESFTWTFYNLRTLKGDVTIRFYGVSNGYYSETATLKRIL